MHKKPYCFGRWDGNSIVDYYYNSTAWMTMDIFDSLLQKFNNQMKLQNQKALLLIDNAGDSLITDDFLMILLS
jgi:hypothetical protein